MFFYCSSLIFVNMKSFKLKSGITKSYPFQGISSYVKFCLQDKDTITLLNEITINNCSDAGFEPKIKIDIINNSYIRSCSDKNFLYEYNNFCYNECPERTTHIEGNFTCLDVKENSNNIAPSTTTVTNNIHNTNLNLEIVSEFTSINNDLNNNNDSNYFHSSYIITNDISNNKNSFSLSKEKLDNKINIFNNNNYSYLEIQDEILKNIQEFLKNDFAPIDIDEGNDLIFSYDKVTYTITSTKNQLNSKNNNNTTVNLKECEGELKQKYNISKNNSLYILKIDNLI